MSENLNGAPLSPYGDFPALLVQGNLCWPFMYYIGNKRPTESNHQPSVNYLDNSQTCTESKAPDGIRTCSPERLIRKVALDISFVSNINKQLVKLTINGDTRTR
jgi:hypothetical protein